MKIKTKDLQEIVTRVSKGASNNKLLPLTSLVEILVTSDKDLLLTTTDATNYFTVKMENVDSAPFAVSVNVDMFTKLVQKMTSEFISVEVLDNYLMVVGNGKYKIDLLIDENGNPVKFPSQNDSTEGESGKIQVATIKKILTNNKASLSVDSSVPCLTNYYCGENVVTTDRYKICQTSVKLFESIQLVSPAVMELLANFSSEELTYYVGDKSIQFDGPNEYLYAPIVSGADKMPIDAINGLINGQIPNKCVINKESVMSVLDRLVLFVSPYDKNTIYLTFTQNGLEITSKKSNGAEKIEYVENDGEYYTCAVDIEMLRSQLNTINGDNITMYYNSPIAVKFVTDDAIRIVALQQDDRVN